MLIKIITPTPYFLHELSTSLHQLNISDLNKLLKFVNHNRVHFLGWAIFIFYETVIIGLVSGYFGSVGNYVVHYSFNIFVFYFHAHYVLPIAVKPRNKSVWKVPLFIILEILVFVCVVFSTDMLLFKYTTIITFGVDSHLFLRISYRALFFIGFSTGYYYLITFIKERIVNDELEKLRLTNIIEQQRIQHELNVTVNAYLKAQINPHFLFNTLNFIYNNARKDSPIAAEAIMTLSEMMRYAIKSEKAEEYISIKAEIEQVENLISLHQLRQNDQLYIKFNYVLDEAEVKFIPLVLMTLAENIFKHGNLSKPAKPALIEVISDKGDLVIRTENLINEYNNYSSGKVGLENIRKRLFHVYGDKAMFNYEQDLENVFHLYILIKK